MSEHEFLTPKEAAALLRVSRATLDRHVKAGNLPQPRRLGQTRLFDKAELIRALEATAEPTH
jgi:excisionase family DNA binding protein